MRPDVERAQLRLPAGALGAPGGARSQAYVAKGYRFVVDIEPAKFFDRVSYDWLVARIAARVPDWRVLRRIRSYLIAGVLNNGLFDAAGGNASKRFALAAALEFRAGRTGLRA